MLKDGHDWSLTAHHNPFVAEDRQLRSLITSWEAQVTVITIDYFIMGAWRESEAWSMHHDV